MRSRESRHLVPAMQALHKTYSNKGLLVVALSAEDCKKVERYIRREKVSYKVGAESKSFKAYKIEQLPAVVLIDPEKLRTIARWSGREVQPSVIIRTIVKFLGPPPGTQPLNVLSEPQEREAYLAQVDESGASLSKLTSDILETPGTLTTEVLSALDSFYEANLPDDPNEDSAETRAQRVARWELLDSDEMGYAKLFSSGRLSGEAKRAVQDRVLQIAHTDPDNGARMSAISALGRYIGQEGDDELLNNLRDMFKSEESPFVRASIDRAMERLDPARRADREDITKHPIALNLRRMMKESPDPASSPWSDAYTDTQTVSQRTTEELFEDYLSFPDPPDDENGRQNATLKRDAALDEMEDRLRRGEICDLHGLKDQFARALHEEPDPFIRKYLVWSGLRRIAEQGSGTLRMEIVGILEKQLSVEPHRNVRAPLEAALKQLKRP